MEETMRTDHNPVPLRERGREPGINLSPGRREGWAVFRVCFISHYPVMICSDMIGNKFK